MAKLAQRGPFSEHLDFLRSDEYGKTANRRDEMKTATARPWVDGSHELKLWRKIASSTSPRKASSYCQNRTSSGDQLMQVACHSEVQDRQGEEGGVRSNKFI